MEAHNIVEPEPEQESRAAEGRPAPGPLAAHVLRFASDEKGNNALEYALISVFIALVLVGVVASIGTSISGLYQRQAAAVGSL